MAANVDATETKVTPFPARVTVTTFNVWGDRYWPERKFEFSNTIVALSSDIYLFQVDIP